MLGNKSGAKGAWLALYMVGKEQNQNNIEMLKTLLINKGSKPLP